MIAGEKFLLQFPKVVDFSVEDDGDCAIGIEHRLVAGREINDRKAAVTQANPGPVIISLAVGTAVANGVCHGAHDCAINGTLARHVERAAYTAHERVSVRGSIRGVRHDWMLALRDEVSREIQGRHCRADALLRILDGAVDRS